MLVKARTFKATFDFIDNKFTKEKLLSFLNEFPEFKKALEFPDISWIPVEFFIKFSEKVDKYFGFGDSALLFEIGSFSAKKAFDGSHKLFKNLSPMTLAKNVQALLSSYYSSGTAESEILNKKKIRLYLKEFSSSPMLAKRIQGWISEALKISGVKEVRVNDTKCKTASICFDIEWV